MNSKATITSRFRCTEPIAMINEEPSMINTGSTYHELYKNMVGRQAVIRDPALFGGFDEGRIIGYNWSGKEGPSFQVNINIPNGNYTIAVSPSQIVGMRPAEKKHDDELLSEFERMLEGNNDNWTQEFIPNIESSKDLCTCGAKHTSFPNRHMPGVCDLYKEE